MAIEIKITDLDDAGALASTDLFEVSQNISTTPTSGKVPLSAIKTFINDETFYEQDIVVSGVEQDVTIVPADASNYFVMTQAHGVTISQTGTAGTISYLDIYLNGVDKNVFDEFAIAGGVGYYKGNLQNSYIFDLTYPIIVKAGAFPTGVTACTIKVIVKGFKIAK